MNESWKVAHEPRAQRAVCHAVAKHDFFKGALHALMLGLLAWTVLAAVLHQALKLI